MINGHMSSLGHVFCTLSESEKQYEDMRFNEEISISDKWSYVNLSSILKSAIN